ncbi:MAG TPA: hypothetical protein VKA50_06080 [Gammaproteobacteria bacterium]|nr:hypothetical protein [Gammaproteobacteria bacterium]
MQYGNAVSALAGEGAAVRRRSRALPLLGGAFVIGALALAWIFSWFNAGAMSPSASELRNTWGIEILGIRTSAAGYMLDYRFRVKDVDKAAPLLDRTIPAYIVVEKSGARLGVPNPPTTGRLRASAKFPKKDRNYFIFFGNPGHYVKAGDRVSVVIGDFKVQHLVVQ